jgi:Spy/CpxP family protein refolding chaperone
MITRILLAGLFASTLVLAQGGRGGGGSRGGDMAPTFMVPGTRIDRVSDALKLTKDQKKDIKATMDDAQKDAAPVHDLILRGRLAIAEAVAAGKPQEEIDKAVRAEAELDTQMASIELHAFAKAVSFLEVDQKQRGVSMLFAMVRGAFNGKNWNTDPQQ